MASRQTTRLTAQEFADICRAGLRDPVWWIETVLNVKLTPQQCLIVWSVAENSETAAASCHSAGKSFIGACIVLWFVYCHVDALVITTAPTGRQVKGILWREIAARHGGANIPLPIAKPITQNELELSAQWFAFGFKADDYNPTNAQGWHSPTGNVLVVFDEAAGISQSLADALRTTATTDDGRLLWLGNPTEAHGPFRRLFPDIDSDEDLPAGRFAVSAFDTPNFTEFGITLEDIRENTWQAKVTGPYPFPSLITPRWVRAVWEAWGEHSAKFQSRVLARFPVLDNSNLWDMDRVAANRITNQAYLDLIDAGSIVRMVVAVDPAVTDDKKSSDETGIVVVAMDNADHFYVLEDGSGIFAVDKWAMRVINLHEKWGADLVVGEVNNGGDLVDRNVSVAAKDAEVKVRIEQVRASRGKLIRADPVATLYNLGRVHHVGHLPGLEDQMLGWNEDRIHGGADRVDAAVWGVSWLAMKSRRYSAKDMEKAAPDRVGTRVSDWSGLDHPGVDFSGLGNL